MQGTKKYIAILITRWIIFLSLLFGSFLTIYQNFIVWKSNKTTTSSDLQYHDSGLELPSITICNKTGYKNTDMSSNIDWQTFMKNTLDLKDFLVGMQNLDDSPRDFKYKIRTTFSLFKGRCYTFEFQGKFKTQEPALALLVKNESQLQYFLHERGFEIWLYFEFWPKKIPFFEAGGFTGLLGIPISKSEFNLNCIDDDHEKNYSQYTCIRKEFLLIQEELGLNCITPWLANMKGLEDIEEVNQKVCNETEFKAWFNFGMNYFMEVLNSKTSCKSLFCD